jgi:hypothetical protein
MCEFVSNRGQGSLVLYSTVLYTMTSVSRIQRSDFHENTALILKLTGTVYKNPNVTISKDQVS